MKLKELKIGNVYVGEYKNRYSLFGLKEFDGIGECYDDYVLRSDFIMIGNKKKGSLFLPTQMRENSHLTIHINRKTQKVDVRLATKEELRYYLFFKQNFNQPLGFLN